MAEPRPLHAVILAGGESRRMGRDKAAVRVDGETQLERTHRLAAAVAAEVVVAVRSLAAADALRRGYTLLADADGDGPLAGIAAALAARPDVDWLVLACDLPLLDETTLEYLAASRATHPGADAIAYRSVHDALPEPLCAIWRASLLPLIRERLAAQRQCARKCLLLADTVLLEPRHRDALANMNTRADLRALAAHKAVS